MATLGIDIAEVDKNAVDWDKAATMGGVRFAFVRATWGTYADKMFPTYWKALEDSGIVRGAYLFLRFPKLSGSEIAMPPAPADQIHAGLSVIGKLRARVDLPTAIDIEADNFAATGWSPTQLLAWVKTAVDTYRQETGLWPLLYTSARVWSEVLGGLAAPELAECPLWLARYICAARQAPHTASSAVDAIPPPAVPPSWGDASQWWIHQYQGDSVGLPGFTSTVDLNRFHVLASGASGDIVRWVQRRLAIDTTGVFDDATKAAVVAFQNTCALVADGVIGPKTFAALAWQNPPAC
jgi:lysozyme